MTTDLPPPAPTESRQDPSRAAVRRAEVYLTVRRAR